MVPTSYELVEALPRNPRGKLDRAALADVPSEPAPLSADHVEPSTELERWVADAWISVLGVDRVGLHDDLFELGGDSLAALELATMLATHVGRDVDVGSFAESPTIAGMVATVERSDVRRARRFVTLRGGVNGARPVVFLPGGGGSAMQILRLAAALDEVSVHAIEPRGMHDRGLADRTVEARADRAHRDLVRALPVGPVVLVGYSAGALVAYELARRLVATGRSVPLLVILDIPVPGWKRSAGDARRPDRSVRAVSRRLEESGWSGLAAAISDKVGRAAREATLGLFPRSDIEYYRRFLALAARSGRSYRPGPYAGRVLVVRSAIRGDAEPTLGWGGLVAGEVRTAACPGDHFTMLDPPALGIVVSAVSAALDAASARSPSGRVRTRA
jgi:thioesterase domain-containing protein